MPAGTERPGAPEAAGPACPECGAPRQADNTPSCECGPRAADALLEARTAEAAAAEDFNPLRIRPYVALEETETAGGTGAGTDAQTDAGTGGAGAAAEGPEGPGGAAAEAGGPAGGAGPTGRAADTGTRTDTGTGTGTGTGQEALPDAAETTMLLRAPGAAPAQGTADTAAVTSVLPTPLAPPAHAPNATDLRMFEPAGGEPAGPRTRASTDPAERRRPRRAAMVGAAVVAVVVLGTAGYASGLFSYESPTRNGASADEVRVGVPDQSTDPASAQEATADASASSEPTSASPSSSASGDEDASPSSSASPSASDASPSASRTTEPSRSATSSQTSAPATEPQPEEDDTEDGEATVLRLGDDGPEVTELQLRLRQIHLYMNDIDGSYDRQVEEAVSRFQWTRGINSEETGTYGPKTREQLERETQEP
ncbi:peptidoglycan-binding protein [Streptomyces sp. ISL-12]|uniref:peptidoglycan-binding domain-containing protein n=1 Tax=Streptomyces sp. ISL-12 TaxID=2819177 RepID=UPI001BE588A2|nr:peptidoglycan-binding domain-containing protein [Streptomyces sp. ISL-12]MBT2414579.1 peptidoglycan-binding protein [Streptomyces sp. ISL-12]